MKPKNQPVDRKYKRRQKAIALVIVLAMVSMMTIFMLAIFSVSRTEHSSSIKYADGQTAKELGDAAVNVVMAQIWDGTTNTTANPAIWASQPGAIRRYTQAGAFIGGYKLYSSAPMQVLGDEAVMNADIPPDEWATQKDIYADLNEPVIQPDRNGDGIPELIFPIIDPRAYIPAMAGTPMSPNVEGFWYNVGFNGVVPASTAVDVAARLPMPVQWLYILKNGSMGTMAAGGGNAGQFVPAASGEANTPSEENPIVGRIAFWTDDEACKININTAGEPTPWYTPTFIHEMDQKWAFNQPMSFEYQRYPGHPATVAMSSVLFPNQPMNIIGPAGLEPNPEQILARKERLYQVLPKLHFGGSRGGTIPYWRLTDLQPEVGVTRAATDSVVQIQEAMRERLYASVDEMMFSQQVQSGQRMLQDQNAETPIFTTNQELERARFFLTAHSRSPEVTMFGTPRIAMWPIADESHPSGQQSRTGYDKLIAFCNTIGGPASTNSYYFRRLDPRSSTRDISLPRNAQLLSYLTNLFGRDLPGGGSYQSKYGEQNTQQMIVQMFDYIRSTNLYDGFLAPTRDQLLNERIYRTQSYPTLTALGDVTNMGNIYRNMPKTGFRTYTPDRRSQARSRTHRTETKLEQIANLTFPGHGQVVPSRIGNSLGIGRFVTVSEVGLQFICTADGNLDKGSWRIPTRNGDVYQKPPPPGDIAAPDPNTYSGGRTALRMQPKPWLETGVGPAAPLRAQLPRRFPVNGQSPGSQPPGLGRFYQGPPGTQGDLTFWYSNYPPQPAIGQYGTTDTSDPNDPRNYRNHPGFWPENWNITLDRNTPLNPGQKRVQAMLNLEICAPAMGYDILHADFTVVVRNLQRVRLNGAPLFIAPNDGLVWKSGSDLFQQSGHNAVGGFADAYGMTVGRRVRSFVVGASNDTGYDSLAATAGDPHRGLSNYDLVSRYATVTGPTMAFTGQPVIIEVYVGHDIRPNFLVQRINVNLPPALTLPVPELVTVSSDSERTRNPNNNSEFAQRYIHAPSWWAFNWNGAINRYIGDWPGGVQEITGLLANNQAGFDGGLGSTLGRFADYGTTNDRIGHAGLPRGNAVVYGFDPATGNFNSPLLRIDNPGPDNPADQYTDTSLSDRWGLDNAVNSGGRRDIRGTDVLFSVVPVHGDIRNIAGKYVVPATDWVPHPKAAGMLNSNPPSYFAHNISRANADANPGFDRGDALLNNRLVPRAPYSASKVPDLPAAQSFAQFAARYGDFDNGVGGGRDGSWINKADAGNTGMIWEPLDDVLRRIPTAYFQHSWVSSDAGSSYATPNRQISSPGMFGSLPTQVAAGEPWRTLLFRPYVRAGDNGFAAANHPGSSPSFGGIGAADHNVMDFFWMPVVEPYAISEPFSTAGKLNMNYQILPFAHITRATGLHAAFKGEIISAVPLNDANRYLNFPGQLRVEQQDGNHFQNVWSNTRAIGNNAAGAGSTLKFWHRQIEPEVRGGPGLSAVLSTLGQFENRFRFQGGPANPPGTGGLFRTASQICEIHLLPRKIISQGAEDGGDPAGPAYRLAEMTSGTGQNNFWMARAITGENTKERVYSNLYGKLTTKSNTFRVHFRAQVIKKARSVAPNEFDSNKDRVASEYRGSTLIERKIDPLNPAIPDYAANPQAMPLDNFYRFRVLETKRFTP